MKPVGPQRKHLLEVYCKCLRLSEKRIVRAGYIAKMQAPPLVGYKPDGSRLQHMAACIAARGVIGHATALLKLKIARSRYAAELMGLPL